MIQGQQWEDFFLIMLSFYVKQQKGLFFVFCFFLPQNESFKSTVGPTGLFHGVCRVSMEDRNRYTKHLSM